MVPQYHSEERNEEGRRTTWANYENKTLTTESSFWQDSDASCVGWRILRSRKDVVVAGSTPDVVVRKVRSFSGVYTYLVSFWRTLET